MSETTSYLMVDCKLLAAKCEATIKRIMVSRETEDKLFLEQELEGRNWWRNLFWLRPLTIEEIRDKIEHSPASSYYVCFPSIVAWGNLEAAEKLLKAAKDAMNEGNENIATSIQVSVDEWMMVR